MSFVDAAEIARTLALFQNPESPATEVSAFNVELDKFQPNVNGKSLKTVEGHFDDPHGLVAAKIRGLFEWTAHSRLPEAFYFLLNPANEALAARSLNEFEARAEHRATDADVLFLRYLLIDFDAQRAKGVSSSDEEHAVAVERATIVRSFLIECGWPPPVLADSANGAHNVAHLADLENTPDNVGLLQKVLQTLGQLFSDAQVHVDLTTFNPARICKLYGTIARKGSNAPTRPHRIARLIDVPESYRENRVTREQLQAFVDRYFTEPESASSSAETDPLNNVRFDVDALLQKNGIEYSKRAWGAGHKLILKCCLFNSNHVGSSAAVLQFASGAVFYKCQHDGCAGKSWHDARDLLDPGWRGRRGSKGTRSKVASGKKKTGGSKLPPPVPELLAGILLKDRSYHFAQDVGKQLYVFRNGTYEADGVEAVCVVVKELLLERNQSEKWSVQLGTSTAEYIRLGSRRLWDTPTLDTINFQNGLLDVASRTLRPHDPAYLSSVQIPVRYDPTATCPAWDRQIADTFPEDSHVVAWQIIAWLMVAVRYIQKALLLLGDGGTGKSTYLSAVSAFLGRANLAAVSLQKLESDRFSSARLVGRLANIFMDLPSVHLETSSMFKLLTGTDFLVPAERKFQTSFEFENFARLVFSANQPPVARDASAAFFDRWLVVPFTRVFRGTSQKISRHELDAKLAQAGELSGVLNRALDVLPEVLKNGITVTPSMAAAHAEFRKQTDPLAIWLLKATVEDPNIFIAKRELIDAFNRDAATDGRATMNNTAFGLELRRQRPAIRDGQRTVAGKDHVPCYLGIGLRSENKSTEADDYHRTDGGDFRTGEREV